MGSNCSNDETSSMKDRSSPPNGILLLTQDSDQVSQPGAKFQPIGTEEGLLKHLEKMSGLDGTTQDQRSTLVRGTQREVNTYPNPTRDLQIQLPSVSESAQSKLPSQQGAQSDSNQPVETKTVSTLNQNSLNRPTIQGQNLQAGELAAPKANPNTQN